MMNQCRPDLHPRGGCDPSEGSVLWKWPLPHSSRLLRSASLPARNRNPLKRPRLLKLLPLKFPLRLRKLLLRLIRLLPRLTRLLLRLTRLLPRPLRPRLPRLRLTSLDGW